MSLLLVACTNEENSNTGDSGSGTNPQQPGTVSITLEAENYTAISDLNNDGENDFLENMRTDASNGRYMQSGSVRNSWLEYQVDLPTDDIYSIAVRGTGTSSDNSFLVSVNGGAGSVVQLNTDDSWGWETIKDVNSGLGPYSLLAGKNIIRIEKRGDSVRLDQLKIANGVTIEQSVSHALLNGIWETGCIAGASDADSAFSISDVYLDGNRISTRTLYSDDLCLNVSSVEVASVVTYTPGSDVAVDRSLTGVSVATKIDFSGSITTFPSFTLVAIKSGTMNELYIGDTDFPETDGSTPEKRATQLKPAFSSIQHNRLAEIVSVDFSGVEFNYTVNVGVLSPETGCNQYADWWELVSESGELIYRRILTHSHSTNANRGGTYLYTLFAANAASGDLTPTQNIDLSGSNASITVETSTASPDQRIRFLLRDAQDDWYLSSDVLNLNKNTTQSYELSGFTWLKVRASAAQEMNELDNGGDGGMGLSAFAGTVPDFSSVTGGGFFIQVGTRTREEIFTDELRVKSVVWNGSEVAGGEQGVVNITLEAEDYTRFKDADPGVDSFSLNTRTDASGRGYMQSVGSWGQSWLEYEFDLPVDGVYEIAVRGTGVSGSTNSFRVSIDDGVDSVVQLNKDDSWGWKTVVDANSGLGPYSLSAGKHTLRLKKRERDAKIDQLKITNASGASLPVASLSTMQINFGTLDVGSASNLQNATLSNTGNAPLNITRINATADFSETNNCGDVLVEGESCLIEISFSPAISGNITGTLAVKSDDANSPAQVSLSGSGKAIVSDRIFFNMDLSGYADGTLWTPEIQNEIFGTNARTFGKSVSGFVEKGQVQIVNDPYGSGKKVLRIELRPEDFGNIITPHINIYKYGAPANMREGTSTLEVALSGNWGHGPTSIHMPFWRSANFVAQRKPILPDVYAFFHQYGGNNSSIDARWKTAGFSGGPGRKSLIDRMANFYTYDQARFQRSAYSNFSDPTVTSFNDLPITQPAQFKTGGYITQQAHIKLSTPGLKNGFYHGYQNGRLVFDRSNIMTLPVGQTEDLKRFAFVFYSNGGLANGIHWNVPDDGKGPKYIYICTLTLQAGGPTGISNGT